jgi:hypothetical protein
MYMLRISLVCDFISEEETCSAISRQVKLTICMTAFEVIIGVAMETRDKRISRCN